MDNAYRPPGSFDLFPPIIKNLIIINGLAFLAQFVAQATQTGPMAVLLNWMILWPLESGLFRPWQLVTYGFLHGGFGHIFFNLLALWMFGAQIENSWGSRRFALYYFVCVIGAGILQLLVPVLNLGAPAPTIGASGGVYGILLAFGMMYPNHQIMLLFPPIPMKAKYLVILYGALEFFSGLSRVNSGVAHFAHLGGMLFGLILILYWRGRLPVKPRTRMYG